MSVLGRSLSVRQGSEKAFQELGIRPEKLSAKSIGLIYYSIAELCTTWGLMSDLKRRGVSACSSIIVGRQDSLLDASSLFHLLVYFVCSLVGFFWRFRRFK